MDRQIDIDSCPVSLPPLSGEALLAEFLRVKESSPGLDGWCYVEFKLLSHCAPWTIDYICDILQLVEQRGVRLHHVDKSSEPPEQPTDLRPLTVLSILYRIWARIRARQLTGQWQELFAHDGMWVGRASRGAEPLLVVVEVASELEACNSWCLKSWS